MQNLSSDNGSQSTVQITRHLIHDPPFWRRHSKREQDFTRQRKLPFMNVVVVLLQKTVRSIQLHLHDFFDALDLGGQSAKPSSFCEARLKLRHSAFIELNERAILDVVYGEKSNFAQRLWHGHRLLAIDSSLIRLPNRPEQGEEFGWVECSNQKGSSARYPQARLSALTDVLNRIVLHTLFVPWQQGERDLAIEHIGQMKDQDIAILDRGFASYELWAQFITKQALFVCRCSKSSFKAVNQLFEADQAGCSVIVKLRASAAELAQMGLGDLPQEITVRFVTVRLATGELEVLATNLLDEVRYPTDEFGALYHQRWGIETYYGLIKSRLDLENFTGLLPEAVRQDVYSTVFLSNFESILIQPAQAELEHKSEETKYRQQVNHAVSFHALKAHIIALLLSKESSSEVLLKLRRLFLSTPVSCRPERKVPRRKRSAWRSYHYQRNTKKSVF